MPNVTNELIEAVSNSMLVITNPTHFAVAVKQNETNESMFVSAKGADEQAFTIRKIACEYKIPIVGQRELARSLYSSVEIGAPIPSNFAEVINEIYGRHLLNFD